jgi:Ca2+:H+ antiporter
LRAAFLMDMIASMSSRAAGKSATGFRGFMRAEVALVFSLGTVAVLLWAGSDLLDSVTQPLWLSLILLWLFGVVLWSAMAVARHADCLAIKCGEPYGTLILTLAAISIEVMMISAAMMHQANNPTLARDTMFAVIMIALNGLVGLSLLLGGLRHQEQQYNLQGTNSYLNAILSLAVLGLILPDFTTSVQAPRFSRTQEIFLVIVSLALYAIFLLIQTARHRQHFTEAATASGAPAGEQHQLETRSTPYHAAMLVVYLASVVVLAEKFAIPLDRSIEEFGVPQAFGGAIVAALVLAPEALSAVRAAVNNHLQRSVNILLGSVLATIGLTIPAVLIIGLFTGRPVILGMQGGEFPLLLLTLAASVVTFASGRTNVLQGCIHLLLFAVFLLLIFCP